MQPNYKFENNLRPIMVIFIITISFMILAGIYASVIHDYSIEDNINYIYNVLFITTFFFVAYYFGKQYIYLYEDKIVFKSGIRKTTIRYKDIKDAYSTYRYRAPVGVFVTVDNRKIYIPIKPFEDDIDFVREYVLKQKDKNLS